MRCRKSECVNLVHTVFARQKKQTLFSFLRNRLTIRFVCMCACVWHSVLASLAHTFSIIIVVSTQMKFEPVSSNQLMFSSRLTWKVEEMCVRERNQLNPPSFTTLQQILYPCIYIQYTLLSLDVTRKVQFYVENIVYVCAHKPNRITEIDVWHSVRALIVVLKKPF